MIDEVSLNMLLNSLKFVQIKTQGYIIQLYTRLLSVYDHSVIYLSFLLDCNGRCNIGKMTQGLQILNLKLTHSVILYGL